MTAATLGFFRRLWLRWRPASTTIAWVNGPHRHWWSPR